MKRSIHQRQASAYLLVLGVSMLVMIVGYSGLTVLRIQHRQASAVNDTAQARELARSAIDLGLMMMAMSSDWRSSYTNGGWADSIELNGGTLSLDVVDPADGDLTDDPCQSVQLTGTGYFGVARQMLRVTLDADAASYDPFGDAVRELNPVAYWRLGEAGSTVAVDSINGYNGVYTNGADGGYEVPFRCDGAATFDGYNDYVEIPHHDAFLLEEGTVLLWFYADDLDDEQGLFGKDAYGRGSGGHLDIYVRYDEVQLHLESASDRYRLESDDLVEHAWHFVVFTFGGANGQAGAGDDNDDDDDDARMKLYVDGQLHDSSSYSGGLAMPSGSGNTEPIALGMRTDYSDPGSTHDANEPFRGIIDEVALFDRAVTADEVAELYAAGLQEAPDTMSIVPGSWQRVVE